MIFHGFLVLSSVWVDELQEVMARRDSAIVACIVEIVVSAPWGPAESVDAALRSERRSWLIPK